VWYVHPSDEKGLFNSANNFVSLRNEQRNCSREINNQSKHMPGTARVWWFGTRLPRRQLYNPIVPHHPHTVLNLSQEHTHMQPQTLLETGASVPTETPNSFLHFYLTGRSLLHRNIVHTFVCNHVTPAVEVTAFSTRNEMAKVTLHHCSLAIVS
jgi:hypothetical protein